MDLKGYEKVRGALDDISVSPKPREGEDARFVTIAPFIDSAYEGHPESLLNDLAANGFLNKRGPSDMSFSRGPKFVVTAVIGDKLLLEDLNSDWA